MQCVLCVQTTGLCLVLCKAESPTHCCCSNSKQKLPSIAVTAQVISKTSSSSKPDTDAPDSSSGNASPSVTSAVSGNPDLIWDQWLSCAFDQEQFANGWLQLGVVNETSGTSIAR